MKLEVSYKRVFGKFLNIWKLSDTFPNKIHEIKAEIMRKTRKCFELNDNETTHINISDI